MIESIEQYMKILELQESVLDDNRALYSDLIDYRYELKNHLVDFKTNWLTTCFFFMSIVSTNMVNTSINTKLIFSFGIFSFIAFTMCFFTCLKGLRDLSNIKLTIENLNEDIQVNQAILNSLDKEVLN